MSTVALPLRSQTVRAIKRDPLPVQLGLTVLALLAMGLFIVLPLVAVFVQAFAKGW
jgi:ABC-type sulfate transport system permease subunit